MTSLDGLIPGVYNMNIGVREWNGDIVFLRRLLPGPADAQLRYRGSPIGRECLRLWCSALGKFWPGLEQSRGKANVVRLEAMSLPGLDQGCASGSGAQT